MEIIKTSFKDLENLEIKKKIYKMVEGQGNTSLKDMINQDLNVIDYVVAEVYNDYNETTSEIIALETDKGIIVSNSAPFRREFLKLVDNFLLPFSISAFEGVAKSGRNFISCNLI